MKRAWKMIPRGDKRAQWAGIYATLNGKGLIVLNRAADERMGSPAAYHLLYDSANNTIGLKPTSAAMRNAYPALRSGRHGGKKVNAYRLLTECSLVIKETLEFPDPEIDEDGILILNLRTARISNRALNHPRRREGAGDSHRGFAAKESVIIAADTCVNETLPGMQERLSRRQPSLLSR